MNDKQANTLIWQRIFFNYFNCFPNFFEKDFFQYSNKINWRSRCIERKQFDSQTKKSMLQKETKNNSNKFKSFEFGEELHANVRTVVTSPFHKYEDHEIFVTSGGKKVRIKMTQKKKKKSQKTKNKNKNNRE